MTIEGTGVVWEGPDALMPYLVEIDEVQESVENARKGDVLALSASLRRFGQVRAICVTPVEGESPRVVAGHHLRLAAKELGWTHIAAIPNEFTDDDERRAYLIADNQLAALGGYDDQKRAEQMNFLDELATQGKLEGTGFSVDDIEDERARVGAVATTQVEDFTGGWSESAEAAQARAESLATGHARKEIILSVTPEDYERYGDAMRKLKEQYGTTGVIDTTLHAVFAAADMMTEDAKEAVPEEPEVIETAAGEVEIHPDQMVIGTS